VQNKQDNTEEVLAGTTATEKSGPRNNLEGKKRHLANTNRGGGKARTYGMKQLSECKIR